MTAVRLRRKHDAMDSSRLVVDQSKRVINELTALADSLREHQEIVRTELAALSFISEVKDTQKSEHALSKSTHTRLGGDRGVQIAVVMLYERVMGDSMLAPYFADVDMNDLRARQVRMFLYLFGVGEYDAEQIRQAHAHLNIDEADFARLMYHVAAVLTYLGVPQKEVVELTTRLHRYEKEIVTE